MADYHPMPETSQRAVLGEWYGHGLVLGYADEAEKVMVLVDTQHRSGNPTVIVDFHDPGDTTTPRVRAEAQWYLKEHRRA